MLDLEALVTDDCSDSLKTLKISFDGTTFIDTTNFALNIVDSDTMLYIMASDFSNNTTTFPYWIVVNDGTPPTAICNNAISISIDALSNQVVLLTEDINNGSRDDCSAIQTLTLSRDTFNCADVGDPITVTLMVTDAAGISSSCTSQVTIQDPAGACSNSGTSCPGFSLSVPKTDVTAIGANDGTATASPGGGSGSYIYTWVNSSNQSFSNAATVTGLAPGIYAVTVRDANDLNCVLVGTVTILEGSTTCDIAVSFPTLINETAAGANDGAVTALASSATITNFTYLWFDMSDVLIGANAGLTGLASGNYAVLVLDTSDPTCSIRDTVAVGPIGSCINVDVSIINASAAGAMDGSATAIATGGSGTYTFTWIDAASNVLTTPTIASLSPGTYTVLVQDAGDASCSVTQQVTIGIIPPPPTCTLGLTFSGITNASGASVADGSATAQGSGGSGAYTYSWSNVGATVSFATGATQTGLAPGTYSVTVRDANNANCPPVAFDVTIGITPPPPTCILGLTFAGINGSSGANGSATAQGSGGSGVYTYSWAISGAAVSFATGAAQTGLAPGTYTVTVRDANDVNCPAVAAAVTIPTITVTQPTKQFIVCDVSGAQGSIIQVPVKVVGFTDVTSFDFSLNIANTAVARFIPNSVANKAVPEVISTPLQTNGKVDFLWIGGTDLADNTVIFTVDVELLGSVGTSFPITIGGVNNQSAVVTCQPNGGSPLMVTPFITNGNVSVGPATTTSLSGRITRPDRVTPISNANVNLSGSASESNSTNTNGDFVFSITPGGSYTVTPLENDNFDGNNRVNSGDLQLIIRHITRDTTLTDPYQLIAADTDRNGLIDVRDITNILRAIQGNPFPNNNSWQFIPTNHAPFPAYMRGVPYVTTYPDSRTVNGVTADVVGQDFVGIKIGDVAPDFATSPFRSNAASSRSSSYFELVIQDQLLTAGTMIEVPVKAKNFQGLLGYFASLKMDGNWKLQGVRSAKLAGISMDNFLEFEEEEMLAMFWVNKHAIPTNLDSEDILFTLQFSVKEGGQNLSDFIKIDSEQSPAFGIKAGEQNAEVHLSFKAAKEDGFELYQNRPNPFTEVTTVGFNLPKRGLASLNVFDMSGRRIYSVKREFPKGYSEIQLHSHTLPRNGVLYYELEAAGQIAQKKMIMIDK